MQKILFCAIKAIVSEIIKVFSKVKLGVNIDHIATLRNARGEAHPSVLRGAEIAMRAGADGITLHLREDRRHIKDKDVFEIKEKIPLPLNLECAATDEMLEISLKVIPNSCCLVPEKREELTTEGGLDVVKNFEILKNFAEKISKKNILPSFFIDADLEQLKAAKNAGAKIVEFHTGKFCRLVDSQLLGGGSITPPPVYGGRLGGGQESNQPSTINHQLKTNEAPHPTSPRKQGEGYSKTSSLQNINLTNQQISEAIEFELSKLYKASLEAERLGIICHAGHGLNYNSIPQIIKIPQISELNIGHFIIGEAVFEGLPNVIRNIRQLLGEA